MNKHILVKLSCLLVLLGMLLPAQQRSAHALTCQSPLTPGHWTGGIGDLLEVQQDQGAVAIDTRVHYGADMDLNISCDGGITGKIFTLGGSTGDTTSDLVKARWDYSTSGVLDASATCDLSVNWEIVKGTVLPGAGGKPKFNWTFKSSMQGHDCTGDTDLSALLDGVLGGFKGHAAVDQRDVTWQATSSASTFASSATPWDDPVAANTLSALQLQGASTKQTANWSMELADAPPTAGPTISATPNKTQKAPLVSFVHGRLQEFFLENTPSVTNRYAADIDWQGTDPGTVTFQLDNAEPLAGEVNGNTASADVRIDNLAAAQNHTLTVTATSSGGTSQSAPFAINIVPVPLWALPYKLQAEPAGQDAGSVIYRHTATRDIPAQPLEALLTIPGIVPFVGGAWGLKQTQFQTGLSVNSLGNVSTAGVTGFGGFAIAGRDIPIEVNQQNSNTQTRITGNQLQFITAGAPGDLIQPGTVNFKLPDQSLFTKKLSLLEAIPGLSTFLDSNSVGKIIKQFDLSVAQVDISAQLSGQGTLGVTNDEVTLTGGSATMGVNAVADVAPSLFGLGSIGVQGNLHGTATFDLTLPPNFTDCSLDGSIFFKYSIIGFDSGTIPSDPSATTLASCSAFQSGRSGSLLMSPLADTPSDFPKLTPRGAGWKPEQSVASPSGSDSAGATRTTLVRNANATLASPAIAIGQDGRMAVAWVSEAPDTPRPQAWHIALRLTDGKVMSAPISLGSSANPAYSPSVAYDGSGQVVVVWVQGSGSVLTSASQLTDDVLRSLDIGYAVVDAASGAVKKSGAMPGEGAMDFAPQLAAGNDGSVWLAWESSPGAWFVSPATSPNLLQAARWDGQGWQPTEQVSSRFANVASWHLAARDTQSALIVAAQLTGDGAVLAFERTAAGWQAQQQLAGSVGHDVTPMSAYSSEGKEVAAWSDGSVITGLTGDLKVAPSLWFTSEARPVGLVPWRSGALSLLLSATGGPGRHGLLLSTLNNGASGWSLPSAFGDAPAPLAVQAAANEDGSLAAVVSQPDWPVGSAEAASGQLPDLASIDLVQSLPIDAQASRAPSTPQSLLAGGNTLLLMGAAAAGVLLLACAAVLVLRRRTRRIP